MKHKLHMSPQPHTEPTLPPLPPPHLPPSPQVFVNALVSLVDSGLLAHSQEGRLGGAAHDAAARTEAARIAYSAAAAGAAPPVEVAPSNSAATAAVLDFVTEMVSAGRVTVPPAFTLRLLSHLVTRATAASLGTAVARAIEEEEAVMQLIRAVGVERLGEAAASGSGRRNDADERLSLQVQRRGGERGVGGGVGGPGRRNLADKRLSLQARSASLRAVGWPRSPPLREAAYDVWRGGSGFLSGDASCLGAAFTHTTIAPRSPPPLSAARRSGTDYVPGDASRLGPAAPHARGLR